uniref:Protein kinase domain-containing protein n=1 Tax=Macrostomum lignano TaxID=282301 RepID=A0A1I8F9P2_9PLAT
SSAASHACSCISHPAETEQLPAPWHPMRRHQTQPLEMERKLRAALEAGGQRGACKRLCGEVGSNIELEHQDESWMKLVKEKGGRGCLRIAMKMRRQSLNFAAMNRKSNSCLKWLVKELGSDCLTVPDKYGNTGVIWPLSIRSIESLEWIKRQIGTDCFRLKGLLDRTAFHFAARFLTNTVTRPSIWPPQHQGIESLEWIKRQIGTDCFRLKGDYDSTAFHFAARKSDNSNLKWLVKELGSDCLTVPDDTIRYHGRHLPLSIRASSRWSGSRDRSELTAFRLKGDDIETAFHFAAEKFDNSNLKWLVKELGSDCLTVPDKDGDTAVHLAAQHQPVDSLQFIFDQIGAEMFSLKNNRGETPADVVESVAVRNRRVSKAGLDFLHAAVARSLSASRWQLSADCRLSWLGDELALCEHRDPQSCRRARETLCRLRHPNIVRFLHIAQAGPATVVVFHGAAGRPELGEFIDKPLTSLTISRLQSPRGAAHLHRRQPPVIHRDINCSNIFVCADNTRIKLIDFGLSIKLEQSVSHVSLLRHPKHSELHGARANSEQESRTACRQQRVGHLGVRLLGLPEWPPARALQRQPKRHIRSPLKIANSGAPALRDGRRRAEDFYSAAPQRTAAEKAARSCLSTSS